MERRMAAIEDRLERLEKGLEVESRKRDDVEANSRLYNLEIGGLPQLDSRTDDPKSLAREVVRKVTGGRVADSEVDVAHRKRGGSIIIRFATRTARDCVYENKAKLRNMSRRDFQGYTSEGKIYLNESLTLDRSALMATARERLKSVNAGKPYTEWARAITDRGVLKLRLPAGGRDSRPTYVKFTSMATLEEALGSHSS